MSAIVKERSVLAGIKKLNRPIFTTFEIVKLTGKTLSTVVQTLNYLENQGVIFKIYRGLWSEKGNSNIDPYSVVPFLFARERGYVSFISALHLYGIIEQIPQVITVASTVHSRVIRTALGVYSVHRIAPSFFCGFGWYRNEGNFLIAEPEKALIDSLYISAYRKKQFGRFPELHFPDSFSFMRAREWISRIHSRKVQIYVHNKLNAMLGK